MSFIKSISKLMDKNREKYVQKNTKTKEKSSPKPTKKNGKRVKVNVSKEEKQRVKMERKTKKKEKKDIDKKINSFHENFRHVMAGLGIYNSSDQTVTPWKIQYISGGGAEGFSAELRFPLSIAKIDIEKALPRLAQGVCGTSSMVHLEDYEDKDGLKRTMFSAIKKWHNVDHELYINKNGSKLKPSSMFLGYNIRLEPIIIDMTKKPHLLITGGSGGGKSKLVEIILTNLANSAEPSELDLYLLQIKKDDQMRYELLKHCKGCVTAVSGNGELEVAVKAMMMCRGIIAELKRREQFINSKMGRKNEESNINIFNELFPKDKLPTVQLWVDEAWIFEKSNSSSKVVNNCLKYCYDVISEIASAGRSLGIYLIIVMQRASKEELNRAIKINIGNWVSFRQKDAAASKVAIGDEEAAVDLPNRVFACDGGDGNIVLAKTPYSKWSKNITMLEEQGKIKGDKYSFFEEYTWFNEHEFRSIVETAEGGKNKKSDEMKEEVYRKSLEVKNRKINELEQELLALREALESQKNLIKTLKEQEEKSSLEFVEASDLTVNNELENTSFDLNKLNIKENKAIEDNPFASIDLSKLKIKNRDKKKEAGD